MVNFATQKAAAIKRLAANNLAAANMLSLSRPVNQTLVTGASQSSQSTSFPVYTVPAVASDRAKWMFAMYLISCGTSRDATPTQVKSLLYSLSFLLYDQLLSSGDGKEYKKVILTPQQTNTVVDAVILTGRDIQQKDDSERAASLRFPTICKMLPTPHTVTGDLAALETEWILVYAYYGLLGFALTKDVTGTGEPALTIARPTAIMSKYRLSPGQVPFIGSGMEPSNLVFEHTYKAWRELPYLRRQVFSYVATLGRPTTSAEDDAVYTTTRLMAWGENAHVALILRFAEECPVALDYPDIAADWSRFIRELTNFVGLCEPLKDTLGNPKLGPDGKEIKDIDQLPFVKMIYLDKISILLRHEHERLLDIAVHFLKKTDIKLEQYQAPEVYLREAAKFSAYHAEFLAEMRKDMEKEDM